MKVQAATGSVGIGFRAPATASGPAAREANCQDHSCAPLTGCRPVRSTTVLESRLIRSTARLERMIKLVLIGSSGEPEEAVPDSSVVREVCDATRAHYARAGFEPPWCGYLAVSDGEPLGVCGFRGPPDADECVEIAYRIFPRHERQGVGSAMVEALVGIARDHNPQMKVRTATEPDDTGSDHLLRRLGFRNEGECQDFYLGRAWCWFLDPGVDPASE